MGKSSPSIPAPAPPPQMPTEREFEPKAEQAAEETKAREQANIGRRQTILTTEAERTKKPSTQRLGIIGGD